MRPEELAEGRRLLGVLFKSAFSNYEENVESWVQWVREHSGRLLNAAERTQKAESERDQALAEVASLLTPESRSAWRRLAAETLDAQTAELENAWNVAADLQARMTNLALERDKALAEIERLRGVVRNWQGDNSGPGGSQEFPDTEVADLRAEIEALHISARVETGISQEET